MKEKRIGRRDLFKTAAAAGVGFGVGGARASYGEDDGSVPAPYEKVPQRVLGSTGLKIPLLLMGGARKFDPNYDKMLHRAFREGVTYLDTGLTYAQGQSEKTIAPFLKQIKDRKRVWITSKVSLQPPKASPERFKSGLDQCLSNLQTDFLDMFFMHEIDNLELLEAQYLKMGDDIRKSGKANLFGFSCHGKNVVALMNKAAKVGGIDAIMFQYNFRMYGDYELNKAMDACISAGIGLIGMKTQASIPAEDETVVDFQSKNFSLAQAKMKAAWADERLTACVSGMKNLQELMENISAAKSRVQLSMAEFHQLNRLAALTAPSYCKGCANICEANIHGAVKVADAMRYLMYYESYGERDKARGFYQALSPEARDMAGVDFTAASKACPQGIDIGARLEKARARLA